MLATLALATACAGGSVGTHDAHGPNVGSFRAAACSVAAEGEPEAARQAEVRDRVASILRMPASAADDQVMSALADYEAALQVAVLTTSAAPAVGPLFSETSTTLSLGRSHEALKRACG